MATNGSKIKNHILIRTYIIHEKMITKIALEAELKRLEASINAYVNPFGFSLCKSYMKGRRDMIQEFLDSYDDPLYNIIL